MSSPYDPRRHDGPPDGADQQPTFPQYDPRPEQYPYEGQRDLGPQYEGPQHQGQQYYPHYQDQASYPPFDHQQPAHHPEQAPYGPYQGQHYAPTVYVQSDSGNNTSLAPVTSLVTGLLGLCTAWIPILGIVAWVLGPLAIVFGILGLRRGRAEHKIMSMIGLVSGSVAVLICFAYVLLFVMAAAS